MPIHPYQRFGVAEEGMDWRGEGLGDIQTGVWGTSLLGWPVPEQSSMSELVPLVLESLGKDRRRVLLSWAPGTETAGRAGQGRAQHGTARV